MLSAWSEKLEGGTAAKPLAASQWWHTFKDPVLNSLIDRAVQSNLDLRIAGVRLREARAERDVTAASLWPAINSSGSYSRIHNSKYGPAVQGAFAAANSAGGNAPSIKLQQDLYQVGFDASWEIDVFGGIRRSVEAADDTVGAVQENQRGVLVSLLAEVARNYVELRGAQRQIIITQDNIKTQRDTLDLTRSRYNAGLTSEIDVLRQEAQLTSTQSQIPTLESSVKRSIHSLGILLGKEPGALLEELSKNAPIPGIPPEVPVGLPSDLLRRRPDVRSAERELAAATAQIGVAVADLFPRFLLTGSAGRQSERFSDLGLGASKLWNVGPSIHWPIFQGGKIVANIKVQNARQEQALAFYEQTILTSLGDVENALVDYSKEQIRHHSLAESVEANLRSVTLSNELYTRGLIDFLNVLDSQRSLYASQFQLVQSEQSVVLNLVALYKALGGGWEAYSEKQ
jgi:multidrug efflux system outer membrane protein